MGTNPYVPAKLIHRYTRPTSVECKFGGAKPYAIPAGTSAGAARGARGGRDPTARIARAFPQALMAVDGPRGTLYIPINH